MNLLIFGCAFLAQYAIGAIIELYPPTPGGGYAVQSYTTAFGAFLVIQLAALVWFVLTAGFIRKKRTIGVACTATRLKHCRTSASQ